MLKILFAINNFGTSFIKNLNAIATAKKYNANNNLIFNAFNDPLPIFCKNNLKIYFKFKNYCYFFFIVVEIYKIF